MKLKDKLTKRLAAAGLSLAAVISGGYLIAPWEGLPTNKSGLHPVYLDAVGIPTVCYGQTGKDLHGRQIRMGMTYTTDECEKMLAETLSNFEKEIDRRVRVEYDSVWQKAAILSFTYNVGVGNLQSSTLLRKLNSGDSSGACQELSRWVYANKKRLQGLVNRRGEEYKWCMGDVPWEAQNTYKDLLYGYVKSIEEDKAE